MAVTSKGIRDLKDNLSHYVRQVEAGARIAVTAHGRIVAELVPPTGSGAPHRPAYDQLVAAGIVRPPIDEGDPLADWPDIRLPAGTAAELIDIDRGEG